MRLLLFLLFTTMGWAQIFSYDKATDTSLQSIAVWSATTVAGEILPDQKVEIVGIEELGTLGPVDDGGRTYLPKTWRVHLRIWSPLPRGCAVNWTLDAFTIGSRIPRMDGNGKTTRTQQTVPER